MSADERSNPNSHPHPHHDERASQLAELGALSQLYAHEVNNLLTQVSARAQLAMMRPDDRELAEHALRGVGDCCQRINQLTQIFLTPNAPRAQGTRPADREPVARIHARVIDTIRESDRAHLGLELDDHSVGFAPDLMPVMLEQVLSNLVLNAMRAIAEHPSPHDPAHQIRITARTMESGTCSTWNTPTASHLIEIIVEDTGAGMEPRQVTQLMNGLPVDVPTQRTGRTPSDRFARHGLGLRVCQKLMSAVGGAIACESTPLKGTRMRVRVPAIMLDRASARLAA